MGRLSAMKESSEMESCALCLQILSRSVEALQAAHTCLLSFPAWKQGRPASALGIHLGIRGASLMAK
jgi:hypothetical protein